MNIEQFFIAPSPGSRVKDPSTLQVLSSSGEWKPKTTYWLRLQLFGDVFETTPKDIKQELKQEQKADLKAEKKAAKLADKE
jgi:hypothetical protein